MSSPVAASTLTHRSPSIKQNETDHQAEIIHIINVNEMKSNS